MRELVNQSINTIHLTGHVGKVQDQGPGTTEQHRVASPHAKTPNLKFREGPVEVLGKLAELFHVVLHLLCGHHFTLSETFQLLAVALEFRLIL